MLDYIVKILGAVVIWAAIIHSITLDWVAYEQQKIISHILEYGSLRLRCWHLRALGRACFFGCKSLTSHIQTWRTEGKKTPHGLFSKGANSIHEDSSQHDQNTSQRPCFLMAIHRGLDFNIWFWDREHKRSFHQRRPWNLRAGSFYICKNS